MEKLFSSVVRLFYDSIGGEFSTVLGLLNASAVFAISYVFGQYLLSAGQAIVKGRSVAEVNKYFRPRLTLWQAVPLLIVVVLVCAFLILLAKGGAKRDEAAVVRAVSERHVSFFALRPQPGKV